MPSDGKSSHCLWHGELKNTCVSAKILEEKKWVGTYTFQ
jgi:hypothetical protein